MNPASSRSASNRSGDTTPSSRTGSCTVASHASGSTHRNRSRVWLSHAQRRFIASSSSAASSGGSDGRTVKLRSAFIVATLFPWRLRPGRAPSGRHARLAQMWIRRIALLLFFLVVLAGIGVAFAGALLYDFFVVPTPAMEPTLHSGDRLLIRPLEADEIRPGRIVL